MTRAAKTGSLLTILLITGCSAGELGTLSGGPDDSIEADDRGQRDRNPSSSQGAGTAVDQTEESSSAENQGGQAPIGEAPEPEAGAGRAGATTDEAPPTESDPTSDDAPPSEGEPTTDDAPPKEESAAYDPGPGWVAKSPGGLPPAPAGLPEQELTFEVVVFGAGTGGSAAAIQAARMGARVALVEETDRVGGQMTAAGVSTMDEGGFSHDAGLYAEFVARAEAHYAVVGKRARRCGSRRVPCTEPRVAEQILRAMLAEVGVAVVERARPVASHVVDRAVVGVKAYQRAPERILSLSAHVFIDATEYGDLLPVVGAAYRLGSSNTDVGLDLSACVQDVTVAPIIRRYEALPGALRFVTTPPGYGPAVERKFSGIVARGGDDWDQFGGSYPVSWHTHVAYRATPDSTRSGDSTEGDYSTITKSGVNWANDYPHTVADIETRRFEAYCEAKLHTLQFLYYVQQVMGVEDWALADDEGYDTPHNVEDADCPNIPATLAPLERHLNPIPYVRESRRMIGLHTLVADDIQRGFGQSPKRFTTSIAVGDYAMDLHGCQSAGDFEVDLESEADLPDDWHAGPFQIPLEALIPRDLDGLLAAEKNISQSRLVSGATRLQPSTMHTGQAAGALAALAVERGLQPRDVPPALVQGALADAGQRLGTTRFSDVRPGSSYWGAVELMSGRGVLIGKGDGTFGVAETMTRAQAAIFLARLWGLSVSHPPSSATFADVPTSHYAFAHIEAVRAAGITTGCGDGTRFCPDADVTRAHMATFMARTLGFDATAVGAATFDDVPSTHTHFHAIQWLADRGLVSGCRDGAYCPEASCTRGQAALLGRRVVLWSVDD